MVPRLPTEQAQSPTEWLEPVCVVHEVDPLRRENDRDKERAPHHRRQEPFQWEKRSTALKAALAACRLEEIHPVKEKLEQYPKDPFGLMTKKPVRQSYRAFRLFCQKIKEFDDTDRLNSTVAEPRSNLDTQGQDLETDGYRESNLRK